MTRRDWVRVVLLVLSTCVASFAPTVLLFMYAAGLGVPGVLMPWLYVLGGYIGFYLAWVAYDLVIELTEEP